MRCEAGRRPDSGYVTAETAVALPALVLLTAVLIWGLVTAAAQIRCVDAARVGARAAARGDPDALALARRVAPANASVQASEDGSTVRVLVEAPCPGPGRLASVLSVRLSAVAVAAREDIIGSEGADSTWPS